ncbi:MAG: cadherin-like beta sandwich domain-containing protein [Chitinivibrionales bacterium]|nr:cadherin-like beta sandwich domain-containing protein [Chitinivibrionales bacterium]
MNKLKSILLAGLLAILFLCTAERDNPFDVGSPLYTPPKMFIDTTVSTPKKDDTTHFDTLHMVFGGNKNESEFRYKFDTLPWSAWDSIKIYDRVNIPDGKHVFYVESRYRQGTDTIIDSVPFFVQVAGYRPNFPIKTDTNLSFILNAACTLSVSPAGAKPFTYQWFKDAISLNGKTSNNFILSALQFSDSGKYRCVASNNYGRDTSRWFWIHVAPKQNPGNPLSIILNAPLNGAKALSKSTIFNWSGKSLPGDSLFYRFYLGSSASQLDSITETSDTAFSKSDLFFYGAKYFWKVAVFNRTKDSASSELRSFTINSPPQISSFLPLNGAAGVGIPVKISWVGTDMDSGDLNRLRYDFYFANKDSGLVRTMKDTVATSMTISGLKYSTTYQWKVVVKDGKDTSTSQLFTFTTFVPTSKLISLQLLNVTLAPAFQSFVKAYAASLPYEVDSITIIPVAEDSFSVIKAGSSTVQSGGRITVKSLPVGLDTIAIKVTARDGIAVDTYTVIVSRTKPNTFQRYFGQTENDAANDVIQTSDSGYIIGGCIGNTSSTGFTRLIKITSAGELSWSKQYGSTSNVSAAYKLVQAANGHYIVLSQYIDTVLNLPHVWLFECDATGTIMWQKTFSCFGYQYEYVRAFAKTIDGGYIIAARAFSKAGLPTKVWLVKTTAAGIKEWDSLYGGPSNDDVETVAPLPDGSFLVGGTLREAGNGNDSAWIFKVDNAGKKIWSKTYPEFYKGSITGMATTSDGSIFVCGTMMGQNYIVNAFIAKLTANGSIVKTTKLEGADGDRNISSIKLMNDGSFALSGWTGPNGNWDGWLLKVNTNCDTLWTRKYGSPGNDFFTNVILTNDGGYILTGYLYNSGMWVVKTDRDGLIW